MAAELNILFLEDNQYDVEIIQNALRKSNFLFNASLATNRDEFVQSLMASVPDVILSDHSLPQFDSLSALEIVKEKYPNIPFILVTGSVSEEFAVKCIKSGAEDYVLKDNLIRLPSIIESAINKKDLKAENRTIRDLNSKLKEAYEIIAQKNKDITDSITYARQIQRAVLPDTQPLYNSFPGSFILYKPKDIISGDFYWFTECKDCFIIAVADCTGHGVPGALLSMIGCDLLKNIVMAKNIATPAGILNELNKGFCDVFKVGTDNIESINDGMDIALCSVNRADMQLTVASAKRPVYIIRNNKLIEIKGEMLPVGGALQNQRPSYKNRQVKLEKGDKVYMFTDGFADQFGGEHGKKLKTATFKEFLLKLASVEIALQKKLMNDFFDNWKKEEEQTDDVLVIGVEI